MKNSDQPAFPFTDGLPELNNYRSGLTKREYIAAMAMQGLLSTPDKGEFSSIDEMLKECANLSVKAADQLLKQLENK